MDIRISIKENTPILLDGSMGALLIAKGLSSQKIHRLNIDDPDVITQIHKDYLKAGCDIILTNTFNITPESMEKCALTVEETVRGAVKAAKKAVIDYPNACIALNLGPSGKIFEPIGKTPYQSAYDHYKVQINAALDHVDLIVIETISDLTEMRACVDAVQNSCNLPIFAAMTFTAKEKTWLGTTLKQWAELSNELNIDAAGLNCTMTPEEMLPVLMKFKEIITHAVFAEPNKGQPEFAGENIFYQMSPQLFAENVMKIYDNGIKIIGGCCGSDAECMALIRKAIDKRA